LWLGVLKSLVTCFFVCFGVGGRLHIFDPSSPLWWSHNWSSILLFSSHPRRDTSLNHFYLTKIIILVYRLNWRGTSTKVWLYIRKLCITTGIMLMPCIILGLLMVRCLSLIWYVEYRHAYILSHFCTCFIMIWQMCVLVYTNYIVGNSIYNLGHCILWTRLSL